MIQHSLIVMAKVFQFVPPSLLAVPISRGSRWNAHKRWWVRVLLMVWLGQRAGCWMSKRNGKFELKGGRLLLGYILKKGNLSQEFCWNFDPRS